MTIFFLALKLKKIINIQKNATFSTIILVKKTKGDKIKGKEDYITDKNIIMR